MNEKFESNGSGKEEIFSKVVRAGKRTYFFDVKSTKANDYYLTITESKKRFGDDGKFFYEKHKLFLYKEDFEKFSDGLADAISHIKTIAPEVVERVHDNDFSSNDSSDNDDDNVSESASAFSNVSFEDLDK